MANAWTNKRTGEIQHISSILQEVFSPLELETNSPEIRIIQFYKQFPDSVVQEQPRVESIKKGVLTVRVRQPAHSQYLAMKQHEIVHYINEQFGEPVLKQIRCRIGTISKSSRQTNHQKDQAELAPLSDEEIKRIETRCASIKDPTVRSSYEEIVKAIMKNRK